MLCRVFTVIITAIIIAAAVAPGLDHGHVVDTFTVAMAIVGAQARPVIRVSDLYRYTGLKRSQIEELIKRQILKPFVPAPGARVRVVFADEVAHLQTMQAEAAEADATAKAAEPEPNKRRRLARAATDESATA
jgi:hypothetical protein